MAESYDFAALRVAVAHQFDLRHWAAGGGSRAPAATCARACCDDARHRGCSAPGRRQ